MSETIADEIPSLNGSISTEGNPVVKESGGNHEDEETWLYGKQKLEENVDNTTAPSIDEVTTQEIDAREKANVPSAIMPLSSSLIGDQLDDDSDDDDIQVTIRDIKSTVSIFPPRQNNRTTIPAVPIMPAKPQAPRGIDLDAQGVINGHPTYEYDVNNAYKDDEKPWKKPGADISDYFNYGFTEETWAQYCDRQRRLRAENNLARLNASQMPQMPPMMAGHPPMMHQMNSLPMVMVNKPPMNMQIMPRPFMNVRKPDGKIDVIGATDQTSRRQMFEMQNNFEHPPFINGPPFSGGQPSNGQTVGDLVATPPNSNGPPVSHGTPPGANHAIQTLGGHRMPMMPPPPGMPFRPQYGHPHAPGGPPFYPRGPGGPMHGERPPPPYFMPHHPQQPPWDKAGVPPVHGFPIGHFLPQPPPPANTGNGRPTSSRSPTPEDHSSRSSTPEENRPSRSGTENDKSSKDDRYTERYRDDRDHYTSSRGRPPSKERSSSSYRSRHRSGDHEYERPRNDRKSSRDRDDKYERYPRKRHHREDSGRHHRGDEDSSRGHRTSHRTPPKNFSSPPKTASSTNSQLASTEPSQPFTVNTEGTENDPPSNTTATAAAAPSSSPVSRSRRGEAERSSSRHSHHKKSSKRSRRDSGDEHSHHHRRSKDKSSSSKKSSNQTEMSSDVKEPIND